MQENNQKGRSIAIVAMIFLFGMIAFVTNLAAPIGVIWKNQPALEGSNTLGMLGNMMNFLAYLFMGIPSGKMLQRIGYKKTALVAVAFGFFGVFIQFLSGQLFTHSLLMGLPTNFYVYLLGAFVAGITFLVVVERKATSCCRLAVRSTRSWVRSPRCSLAHSSAR